MPDVINARGSESKFKPHPTGQFVGLCVDAIDLGEKVDDFPGKPPYLVQKCALVFRTGEKNPDTGDFIDVAQEYTVSMGEKANLRKALESWRGQPYDAEAVKKGVPIHKLVGNWALLNVAHKTSGKGREYAYIQSLVGVPKAMRDAVPSFPEYKRPDFWAQRKDEYKKEAQKFRSDAAAPPSDDFEEFPGALQDEEDDLPF